MFPGLYLHMATGLSVLLHPNFGTRLMQIYDFVNHWTFSKQTLKTPLFKIAHVHYFVYETVSSQLFFYVKCLGKGFLDRWALYIFIIITVISSRILATNQDSLWDKCKRSIDTHILSSDHNFHFLLPTGAEHSEFMTAIKNISDILW